MYCTECGKKVSDNLRFCPECGSPVRRPISFSKASSPRLPDPSSSSLTSLGAKIVRVIKRVLLVLWFWLSAALSFLFFIVSILFFLERTFTNGLIALVFGALFSFFAVIAYKNIPTPNTFWPSSSSRGKNNMDYCSSDYSCPHDLQTPKNSSQHSYTSLSRDSSQTNDDSNQKNYSSFDYSGWNISISFGKSSSQNYQKALTLAHAAPQYHEQVYDGNILHQATYSASSKDYLAFIMLYELVCDWKSSFVFINGQPIDRKIIGQLNYCYGDKCRSTDPRYCFGASYMTENPFGCHRIQISAANHPWWSYYRIQGNKYVLDIDEMLQRIYSAASKYSCCPCFNLDSILKELYKLPRILTQRQMDELRRDNFGQRM